MNNGFDGEVSIHGSHLVMKAPCNTLDYVLYMTADSANGGPFFSISPPLVNRSLFLPKETWFYIDVVEVLSQGPSGALSHNYMSLQSDIDIV